jgi:hypothetical protein
MENSSTNLETPAVFRSARGRNLQVVGERTATPAPDVAARAAALEAKEKELQAALATVKAAFAILGSRAVVMISLLAAIGAFGWVLYDPSGLRLAAACLVTAMGFLPSLWADRMRG